MLEKLTQEERALLAKALKSVRDNTRLTDQDLHAWAALFGKLDEHWQAFLQAGWDAVSRLADDPDNKKAAWVRALSRVENEWNRHIKESLQAAANLDKVSEEVRKDLAGLQLLLDELALAQVPDNTMSLKPRHQETWYRLLDILSHTSHEELQTTSIGRVGVLQLAQQPQNYRGKVVTIRGTARLANWIKAPANIYGIKHWYVFWVRPIGGSPQPYTVYTLEVPKGFP